MGNLPFLPTISTLCIVLSAVCMAIGLYFIKKRKKEAHKKMMLSAATLAVLFLIIYASRTIVFGNTAFGGPDEYKIYYTIFLVFHILLSTSGAILGGITIRHGLKNNFDKHRKIGPIAAIIWFGTAITGVMVYLLLYVFFSGGETTSMIKAIFGF